MLLNILFSKGYQRQSHFTLCNGSHVVSVAVLMCLIAHGIAKTNAVPTDSTDGAARTQLLQRALRDVAASFAASFAPHESKDKPDSVPTSAPRAVATPLTAAAPAGAPFMMAAAATAALVASSPDEGGSGPASPVQPQGLCLLDGVLVADATVVCAKQQGCRAIQKTGHCCPDYRCDCEKDGRTYANGYKLVDPENPCTVCYCKGGEILCSSVTCFHRDDCTPKYIAGRCCPEYDNCPVSTPEPDTTTNKTIASPPATPKPGPPANNQKITIKEITKPTEIRITDDNKAIHVHQMLKPTDGNTAVNNAKLANTSADTNLRGEIRPINSNNGKQSGSNESLKLSVVLHDAAAAAGFSSGIAPEGVITEFETQEMQGVGNEGDNHEDYNNNKVNIKREFLDTRETPMSVGGVTAAASAEENASAELIYTHGADGSANGAHTANSPPRRTSAEAAEPDAAGSDSIYHIILATDGLRLSGSSSSTESYLALKGLQAAEGLPASFEPNPGRHVDTQPPSAAEATQQPSNSSASTQSSAEVSLGDASSSTTAAGMIEPSAAAHQQQSSTEAATQHHPQEDEDGVIPAESNPAYPSLPEDDFSLRDVNFPLSEGEELVDEPRSISGSMGAGALGASYDAVKSIKKLDDADLSDFGRGSGDHLVESSFSSASTESYSEPQRSSTVVALMYSTEDLSGETAIAANTSDFQLGSSSGRSSSQEAPDNESSGSGESLELDSEGGGSGAGSSEVMSDAGKADKRRREPTTPRPTRRSEPLDIDELGSSADNEPKSPAEDPKLDAESLKLDENQDAGLLKQDAQEQAVVQREEEEAGTKEGLKALTGDALLGGDRVQRLFLHRFF